MYPPDMCEMAFGIILDLVYLSPVHFNQVHSHVNFVCKEEYEECIADICHYIVRNHYPRIPDEKAESSDFLLDTQRQVDQVHTEALARGHMLPSTVNDTDKSGRDELSYACERADLQLVLTILHFSDSGVNRYDNIGRSPLSYAFNDDRRPKERIEIVKLLLQHDKSREKNIIGGDDKGWSPLSYAAKKGSREMVELLLQQEGVAADSRDNNGRVPLSCAAEYGNKGAMKLLLHQEGINPDSRDKNGRSPLSYAAEKRSDNIVKLLLQQNGVDPDSRDKCV